VKRFLVINPFGIGDVLFTTPVCHAIKERIPGSFVGFWCNERVKELLDHVSDVDTLHVLSRGDLKNLAQRSKQQAIGRLWRIYSGIRRQRYDAALDYSLDMRYGMVTQLAGIPRRIGLDYKGRCRFLTDRVLVEGRSEEHMVEHYMHLLTHVGIKRSSQKLRLSVSDSEREEARGLLVAQGLHDIRRLIAVVPGAGASWGEQARLKRWESKRFAVLARRLITEAGASIVILGDAPERPLAQAIVQECPGGAVDLTGNTSLSRLIGIIACCRLVVTNDGGPLHVAVALGTPTVSLFGPVDPVMYGPFPPSDEHVVIASKIACRPCYRGFRMNACARNVQCLDEITIDDVFKAIRRFV
jgi:lipopolysaccharide heptosyltransferase II